MPPNNKYLILSLDDALFLENDSIAFKRFDLFLESIVKQVNRNKYDKVFLKIGRKKQFYNDPEKLYFFHIYQQLSDKLVRSLKDVTYEFNTTLMTDYTNKDLQPGDTFNLGADGKNLSCPIDQSYLSLLYLQMHEMRKNAPENATLDFYFQTNDVNTFNNLKFFFENNRNLFIPTHLKLHISIKNPQTHEQTITFENPAGIIDKNPGDTVRKFFTLIPANEKEFDFSEIYRSYTDGINDILNNRNTATSTKNIPVPDGKIEIIDKKENDEFQPIQKILAVALGYDGCIATNVPFDINNKKLQVFLDNLVDQCLGDNYTDLEIFIGTKRQIGDLDKRNADANSNGSCYPAYLAIENALNKKLAAKKIEKPIQCHLNKELTADYFNEEKLQGKPYFDLMTSKNPKEKEKAENEKKYDCPIDESKVLIAYPQMQHLAKKYGASAKIDYVFTDDYLPVLQPFYESFSTHSHLIPNNTCFKLQQFSIAPIPRDGLIPDGLKQPIQGTGLIDKNYQQTTREIFGVLGTFKPNIRPDDGYPTCMFLSSVKNSKNDKIAIDKIIDNRGKTLTVVYEPGSNEKDHLVNEAFFQNILDEISQGDYTKVSFAPVYTPIQQKIIDFTASKAHYYANLKNEDFSSTELLLKYFRDLSELNFFLFIAGSDDYEIFHHTLQNFLVKEKLDIDSLITKSHEEKTEKEKLEEIKKAFGEKAAFEMRFEYQRFQKTWIFPLQTYLRNLSDQTHLDNLKHFLINLESKKNVEISSSTQRIVKKISMRILDDELHHKALADDEKLIALFKKLENKLIDENESEIQKFHFTMLSYLHDRLTDQKQKNFSINFEQFKTDASAVFANCFKQAKDISSNTRQLTAAFENYLNEKNIEPSFKLDFIIEKNAIPNSQQSYLENAVDALKLKNMTYKNVYYLSHREEKLREAKTLFESEKNSSNIAENIETLRLQHFSTEAVFRPRKKLNNIENVKLDNQPSKTLFGAKVILLFLGTVLTFGVALLILSIVISFQKAAEERAAAKKEKKKNVVDEAMQTALKAIAKKPLYDEESVQNTLPIVYSSPTTRVKSSTQKSHEGMESSPEKSQKLKQERKVRFNLP